MKKRAKKLILKKETIRALTSTELNTVAGGTGPKSSVQTCPAYTAGMTTSI